MLEHKNWRRDRDLNPGYPARSTIDFESTAFDHSAISPTKEKVAQAKEKSK